MFLTTIWLLISLFSVKVRWLVRKQVVGTDPSQYNSTNRHPSPFSIIAVTLNQWTMRSNSKFVFLMVVHQPILGFKWELISLHPFQPLVFFSYFFFFIKIYRTKYLGPYFDNLSALCERVPADGGGVQGAHGPR